MRQGCPASPSLFTIALDPFLNYRDSLLDPRDRLRAYADDIGFVLEQLWVRGPMIAFAFARFARIANFKAVDNFFNHFEKNC